LVEVAFFLFFLPYTMAYNWVWDKLRERWIRRHACRA
ncbi:MAG: chlorhexidine efflux transporter, partial [Pantoea agglomerans]